MAAAVECVVIGGGVVGLACARRAALSGLEVKGYSYMAPHFGELHRFLIFWVVCIF